MNDLSRLTTRLATFHMKFKPCLVSNRSNFQKSKFLHKINTENAFLGKIFQLILIVFFLENNLYFFIVFVRVCQ